jgi:glyoxylase-like metal-dependent hydrolase (beta-lactamase superfamily II)
MTAILDGLSFPFETPPGPGEVIQVAPGILWARLPLPFSLDHVNIFLLEDGDGWALIDTGIKSRTAQRAWETLLEGPLRGRRLTRIIVTHFHPDHIGLAGWLAERFDAPVLTSQTSYLECRNIAVSPGALDATVYWDFYRRNGLDEATTALLTTSGHFYLKMVSPLPPTFGRVVQGETLRIGGRDFSVLAGNGHAPEMLMLYCAADRLLLAADQVLAKISPNVSVAAMDPHGDPLGLFLGTLEMLRTTLPAETFVLPGHQLPFHGLHERISQLAAHHAGRCELLVEACRVAPRPPADLLPVMFRRTLDPHQMGFAFSELLAHVNFLLRRGALVWGEPADSVSRVRAG